MSIDSTSLRRLEDTRNIRWDVHKVSENKQALRKKSLGHLAFKSLGVEASNPLELCAAATRNLQSVVELIQALDYYFKTFEPVVHPSR